MQMIISIFYFILFHLTKVAIGNCGAPSNYNLRYATVEQSKSIHNRQLSFKLLRLKFILYYTDSFNQLADSEEIKKKIIIPATKYWENSLRVRLTSLEKFYVQRYCEDDSYSFYTNGTKFCDKSRCRWTEKCQGVDIPAEYMSDCLQRYNRHLVTFYGKGKGMLRNNYLLIVDSRTVGSCRSITTNAFAASCDIDPDTDRPIVGYVNFCPFRTVMKYPGGRRLYGTARHEIAHALGFSKQHFAFMRYKNGSARTVRNPRTKRPFHTDEFGLYIPSDKTIKDITREWVSAAGIYRKTFPSFVTESLVKEAKKHFRCPLTDGVDLENEGAPGSRGTHFDGRLFSTELMSPSSEIDSFASRLTFAYFDDSGWYNVNYQRAEPLKYGNNLGCEFSMQSCYAYAKYKRMSNESILPYCDQPHTIGCRDDYSYGMCAIGRYERPLPLEDQFFDRNSFAGSDYPYYGGSQNFKDKCPVLGYLSSLGSLNVTSFCTHDENNQIADSDSNDYLQSFGKKAICVKHLGPWTYELGRFIYTLDQSITGTCHKYICTPEKILIVDFRGSRVKCPVKGGRQSFSFKNKEKIYRGAINCPPANKFCQ
ncbi:unnamed protein product [Schistosoma turkestanicum]|nr:unnamed protein product [Schistosoma turkestanicum]